LREAASAEILRSLRAMKLIAEDEEPALIELTGGVSADIVLAKTKAGPICVKRALPSLKVAGEWHVSPARSEAEKNWIRLVGRFLPSNVPEILGEDTQTFTFAMKYLDPEHYRNWKSHLRDGEIDDEAGLKIGEVLGAVHCRTAGDASVAAAFANDRDFADIRLNPYFVAAALKNPDAGPALHSLTARTASVKQALVHGDFSPKNILIGPSGPVILDAECACYGDPAFDPAFLLNHLLLKCVWKPHYASRYLALAEVFWQAYMAAAPALAPLAIEERTVALLPGLLLARIDGKSPVEYLTDPAAKDRVRQFAKRFLLKPERSLVPLFEAWRKEFCV
jgi:Phosphotransferase enzyme family